MATQLCFFEDFDSLEVTASYLELGHRAKLFRFVFPDDHDLRKFSVKTIGGTQITLTEMSSRANGDDSWFELPSVALCVEFTDVMKFANFVTKIGNLAHYQQLVLPLDDSEVDEDEDFEDENDFDVEGIDGHENSDEQILRMNPMYSVLEDYTLVVVTQGYIEITVDGKILRFTHNATRRYTAKHGKNKCPKLPKHKTAAIFIPGVILQGKSPAAQQYDDVCDVNLYIEIEDATLLSPVAIDLKGVGYAPY